MKNQLAQMPESHANIIQAATKEFSEKGFAGARMDVIAKRAGVNKAMLYYHIGDKKALYAAVLHVVFASIADLIEEQLDDTAHPEANLRLYIQMIADNFKKNPIFPPIMLREVAQGGKNLPEVVIQDFFRLFRILTGILQKGAKEGVFEPTLALPLHMMIIGPMMFYTQMMPKIMTFAESLNEKGFHPDTPLDMGKQVEEMIMRSVLKQ